MVDSSSKRFLVSDRGLMGKLSRDVHMHSIYKLKLDLAPKNPILADTCMQEHVSN